MNLNRLQSLTVASGNRILGTIEGSSSESCLPKVIPKYVNGQSLCSIQKCGRTRIFVSPLNGAELGRAGELATEGVFEIRLSPGLDVTTKGMLFAAGYMIVSTHYQYSHSPVKIPLSTILLIVFFLVLVALFGY